MRGEVNTGYVESAGDELKKQPQLPLTILDSKQAFALGNTEKGAIADKDAEDEDRQQWGSGMEFLMSCIAMSVGLGNIWRFPFTAYENGGGAFLIPYIIVLIVIGRPFYFMEMALGQFSARGNVKMFQSLSPVFVGVGYGQMVSTTCVATYYCSLMALTLFYLYNSFASVLPWAQCDESWDNCYDSSGTTGNFSKKQSSSELYFYKTVLRETDSIDDGIGLPDWRLALCLFIAWMTVFLIMIRGVKSSGKAAYFLALFPYVVMFALLIRACTLEGAADGILYFIKPQWGKLLEPGVWYAAVTQAFFSLNVCFGSIIMYSSYNDFSHNIYRDAMVVTTLDTFTSLLAGFTIFGILGNLAYETDADITEVVKGGTGLAFVSYPDAIAKFEWCPQLFAVLFFLMLYTLGIGSLVALHGSIVTIITDQFPSIKTWQATGGTVLIGFLVGLIYCTPGGQWMLNLVDYYGGTFIVFILAIAEAICVSYVYGLENICQDLEFMLNIKPGIYWRLCWAIFTPGLLIIILIYSLVVLEPLEYAGKEYPEIAIVCGWLLLAFGVAQLPFWAFWAFYKNRNMSTCEMISTSFKPLEWGPKNAAKRREWEDYKTNINQQRLSRGETRMKYYWNVLIGRKF